ncbi:MAG TPA: hypothetical protein VED40_09645 [Azospirillaceae bacterium]|nr:hypothetical protein [Azospirillaceae bacterium]
MTPNARLRAEQLIRAWGTRRALEIAERYVTDAQRSGAGAMLDLNQSIRDEVRRLAFVATPRH